MCRRHDFPWILLAMLAAPVSGREVRAQTDAPLPPALEGRQTPPATGPAAPPPNVPSTAQPVVRVNTTPNGLPINLATAMQLAGVRPLDIAAAVARIQQAVALQTQAKALWVPSLNAGVDYHRHDGYQQNIFKGGLFTVDTNTFFVGGGPTLNVGVTDVIFAPLAARRVVAARRADLQTAYNDVLFSVAQAFFTLQDARGRLLGVDATIVRADKLVNFAEGLAPSLVAPFEVNRAKAELQSLLQDRELSLRDWRVASASLAEILLMDPGSLLEPIEPPFLLIGLIPGDPSSDELLPVAISNRPEIASQTELVAAANALLRQEKNRPLLPNLVVLSPATATGLLSAGNVAGGPNRGLGSNEPRADFEVAAVWQLQNGGIGNVGRIRQRRAEQESASIELTRTLYRVRADVSQALARLQTARARVPQTEEGLRQAIVSVDKNFEGLRETTRPAGELLNLVVRPQEVVAAIIAVNTAYQEYSAAVNQYNLAQFELYRALGQPAQWVTAQAGMTPPPGAAGPAHTPAAAAARPMPPTPAAAPPAAGRPRGR